MALLDDFDEGSSTFYIVLFILIGSGVFTILMCCLGCCGSSKRSRSMLLSVFICLLVVFIAEIVVGIWALENKEQVSNGLKSFYDNLYSEYWKTRSSYSKIILNLIHKMLDCCGSNALSAVIETFVNDVCPNDHGFVSIISNALKDCHTRIDQTSLIFVLIMGSVVGLFLILGMVWSLIRCCTIHDNQQVLMYQHLVEGGFETLSGNMHHGSSAHAHASFPLNPTVPLSEYD